MIDSANPDSVFLNSDFMKQTSKNTDEIDISTLKMIIDHFADSEISDYERMVQQNMIDESTKFKTNKEQEEEDASHQEWEIFIPLFHTSF